MLWHRLWSFLLPLLIALVWASLFWQRNWTYGVLLLAVLLSFGGSWLLVAGKISSFKEKLFYAGFGLLLVLSSLFAFLLLENIFLKIILAIATIALFFFYVNELFIQYWQKVLPQNSRLFLFFRFAQILVVFWLASGLFGLRDFLGIHFFYLGIALFVLISLIGCYSGVLQPASLKRWQLIFIISLLIMEMFWALGLLPLVYYLKAAFLAIFYALTSEVLNWHFSRSVSFKFIRNYLILAIILILLLLAAAQWS